MSEKLKKSDADWQAELTPEQFHVTRKAGTERAFTGPYWDEKAAGTYSCICCKTPLFRSETKYDSGTGWPSFFAPIEENVVRYKEDRGLLGVRIEVVCAKCDAHLGHIFDDGPAPTGKRYCMNGTALSLAKDSDTN